MTQPESEPTPVWADAPRYAPARQFPPYRFVPGLNPHPTEHPDGHQAHAVERAVEPLNQNWRANEDYLVGFDLYHQGYFWEAHEAWEGVWRLAADESVEKHLLHALILNAAAQLKLHVDQRRGAATHSRNACAAFAKTSACAGRSNVYGVDVQEAEAAMRRCYDSLWADRAIGCMAAPRFRLQL